MSVETRAAASEPSRTAAAEVVRVLAMLAAAATIVLLAAVAMTSYYGTDEFNYAHAAWAIAHGQQPYRDFFLHHFPGAMQLGSAVFAVWDDPRAMAGLRWLMVPFWLAAAVAIVLVNRRHGLWPALLSIPLLGSLSAWVQYATQFRPDPIAIAFFLISVLLATDKGPHARPCAFAAGVCFVFAARSSQKVLIYGIPLILAWVATWIQSRVAPSAPRPLAAPAQFALGLAAGAVPIALYLTVTGIWTDWWSWCLYGGITHERFYPERSPLISFRRTLPGSLPALALGLVGFVWVLWRLAKRRSAAALADTDAILLACGLTTTVSYTMQQAPYGWSLVAPLSFVALFAARGLGELVERALGTARPGAARAAFAAGCVAIAFANVPFSARKMFRTAPQRATQEAMLADVARLSAPTDAVYDNTGYYVARPHAHFFFWTDQSARVVHRSRLIREIPTAILTGRVTMRVRDRRDKELPAVLSDFLDAHFVCVLGDVCLWGRTYQGLDARKPARFTAVRTDRYYVTPGSLVRTGQFRIDGTAARDSVFPLARGEHEITWTGASPAAAFSILWLPRSGEMLPPEAPTVSVRPPE